MSGRLPFRARSASAVLAETLDPSPLTLDFPPALPAGLERIVRKLLAKAPDERYQHADEVAVDLRALARDEAAGGAPASTSTSRGLRRRWAVATCVALFLVLAAVGVRQWQTPRVRGPLPSKVAEANETLSRAMVFLTTQQDLPRCRSWRWPT